MSSKYYAVVVRDQNSWSPFDGKHEERANCGHHHKTVEAAQNCLLKLTAPYKDGSTPAQWYNARLENQDGRPVDEHGNAIEL